MQKWGGPLTSFVNIFRYLVNSGVLQKSWRRDGSIAVDAIAFYSWTFYAQWYSLRCIQRR